MNFKNNGLVLLFKAILGIETVSFLIGRSSYFDIPKEKLYNVFPFYFLLSGRNCCNGSLVVVVLAVVAGAVVGAKEGQAPFVNLMLSIAISLLHTLMTASICIYRLNKRFSMGLYTR